MALNPDIYKKIVAAKLYMDQCFREPLCLEQISREACISRFHFHRLFSRIYHKTPHQYLTRKRIEHAQQLLVDKNLTVTEVCNSVGFESIGSFSGLFKKETGIGPSLYRNRELEKKQQARQTPGLFIPHCFIQSSETNPLSSNSSFGPPALPVVCMIRPAGRNTSGRSHYSVIERR